MEFFLKRPIDRRLKKHMTYLNPRYFPNNDFYSEPEGTTWTSPTHVRHRSPISSRSPTPLIIPPKPKSCDIWITIPLIFLCCLCLITMLMIFKNSQSFLIIFSHVNDSICRNVPKKKCKEYKQFLLNVKKYISSKPDEKLDCNISQLISEEELQKVKKTSFEFIPEDLRHLGVFYYNEGGEGSYFVYEPRQTFKCQFIKYVRHNKKALLLISSISILTIYLTASIYIKINHKTSSRKLANSIVQQMIERGHSQYSATEFEPHEKSKEFKYWKETMNEIERNKSVATYNSVSGKIWKIIS